MMRRRFFTFVFMVFATLALGARPPLAACSILPVPPEQQARMVQDTIAGAALIARGTVIGTRPVVVDGRYHQQLTRAVATIWRGAPAAQVTVIGGLLTFDTSPASTLGVFTGTAPLPACGNPPHAVGDDLLVLAQDEGRGRLRLSTATSPNDPLAMTLRAQLGPGAVPPPASPASPPFFPLLIGTIAAVIGVALVGMRRQRPRWFRRR